LATNINDHKNNTTRFLIIKRKRDPNPIQSRPEKGTLLFRVKDQPAILFKCLGAFATRFINLTKIESIPSKKGFFEYMFWIDYQLPSDRQMLEDAIAELRFYTTEIQKLGIYGKA
jgi:prephenate dehydratase